MSVPQRLTRQLQRALGGEAAEDLVNLLDGVELQRSEMRAFREGMRADFAEFRETMRSEQSRFLETVRGELTQLREEVHSLKADLMKWSFVFWTGAVLAIAALAGVLR